MVNGVINGFVKASGQYCLKLLSYDLSKFFFEERKRLSPPKLNNIFWWERQQKFKLVIIFNPTTQLSVDFKNGGVRAKLEILKSTLLSSDFRLRVKF